MTRLCKCKLCVCLSNKCWQVNCESCRFRRQRGRVIETLTHLRSLMNLPLRWGNIPVWQHEALSAGLGGEGERWETSKPRHGESWSPPVHFCRSEILRLHLFSSTRFSPAVSFVPCSQQRCSHTCVMLTKCCYFYYPRCDVTQFAYWSYLFCHHLKGQRAHKSGEWCHCFWRQEVGLGENTWFWRVCASLLFCSSARHLFASTGSRCLVHFLY